MSDIQSTATQEAEVSAEVTPTIIPQPLSPPPVSTPNNKKKFILPALIAAAVVVIFGASAGAYFGVIAPNKPENILKTATQKLLEMRQLSSKGTVSIDMNAKDASLKNITITFTGSADSDKKTFAISLDASASGVKLPLELRAIDQNFYFKVGDLSTIKSVAAQADPSVAPIIDALSSKLSNQWVEIDQSLLKQANLECATNTSFSFTHKDIDQIMKVYGDNQFLIIKNKASERVEGVDTTRYELALDYKKAEAFGKKLNAVDSLKKAAECGQKATDNASGDTEVKDDTKRPQVTINVWVDSSKTFRQFEIKVTDKDVSADAKITMTNEKVNITIPSGAKPLVEVLGDFSALFGGALGGSTTPTSSTGTSNSTGLSQKCLDQYQAFAASGGTTALPTDCE